MTSTLEENLDNALRKVGLPLFQALSAEIASWNTWLDANGKIVEEWTTKAGQALRDGFGAAKDAVLWIVENKDTLITIAELWVGGRVVGGIVSAAFAIGGMVSSVMALGGAASALAVGLAALAGPVAIIAGGLAGIAAIFAATTFDPGGKLEGWGAGPFGRADTPEAAAKRKAEQDARDAEQRRIEAQQQAESDRLAEEQRKIEAEKQRLERAEFERQAKEKAEQEARERVERERVEAEQRKRAAEIAAKMQAEERARAAAEAKRLAEAEAARIEAARPDVEKVNGFGCSLELWIESQLPATVTTPEAAEFLNDIRGELNELAQRCQQFAA